MTSYMHTNFRTKLKIILSYSWLPCFILLYLISFELKYDFVGITFLFVIAQSVISLNFFIRNRVNLISVYFVFNLVFFGLLPWLHYSSSNLIWRSSPIFSSTYLSTNLHILLGNLTVLLVYVICFKHRSLFEPAPPSSKNRGLTKTVLMCLSLLSFTLVFYLNDFSILSLLFRGLAEESKLVVVESSALSLLLGNPTRLIPVFCFYFAVSEIRGSTFTKLFLFFLMLLSVFPTGVARYTVAYVYIPLVLLVVPALRNASFFSATLLGALFYIFPFLDQFRNFQKLENLSFLPTLEFFYAGHFDAYENFATAIENGFVSHGYQLLGTLLFYIPREYWPEKPVGSGSEMAERLGYSFGNISMPFLGEGYVNFGAIGVVLFASALGFTLAKADSIYALRSTANLRPRIDYPILCYYFLIGVLFFILRGDLLSSSAFAIAALTVSVIIARLTHFTDSLPIYYRQKK